MQTHKEREKSGTEDSQQCEGKPVACKPDKGKGVSVTEDRPQCVGRDDYITKYCQSYINLILW